MDASSVLLQIDTVHGGGGGGGDGNVTTLLSVPTPTAAAPPTPLSPVAQTAPAVATARVVVLTINDVYELFPSASGQGGMAEFATLLRAAKERIPSDAHVIVTLNGDFLWRSELDREDKGALMIDVLNALEIEFVVLGNHEFDFGAPLLLRLLTKANFTSFGSNIRQRCSNGRGGELFPGLVDYQVLPLANGLKLGLFGVSTTVTGEDPFAGEQVVFEDPVPHAKRCVAQLQTLEADAIVALTHFKVAEDKALASQVPGINLILGGHDHEIMTLFKGETMIHKSGQDALWLGVVELLISKTEETYDKSPMVSVEFQWQMLCNRGFEPDPACRELITEYSGRVYRELKAQGKLDVLAVSRTMLDGSRASCRTQETNLGNLIADALREELHADVAVINAGFMKGDRLHDSDLEINAHWLEKFLPLRKPSILVEMSVGDLKSALTQMLRKFPSMSSSFPQISGCSLVYDAASRQITSFSIGEEQLSPQDNDQMVIRVATARVPSIDGWEFFERGTRVQSTTGEPRLVRDLVGSFVKRQGGEIAYPHSENRLVILR